MKPICSARNINGVHVVTLPEANKKFIFLENTYEGQPKAEVTTYPGTGYNDPKYINFAKKRQVEIKNMVAKRKIIPGKKKSLFSPQEQALVDAVFNMPLSTKHIHNHTNVIK